MASPAAPTPPVGGTVGDSAASIDASVKSPASPKSGVASPSGARSQAELAGQFGQGLADLLSPLTTQYDDALRSLTASQHSLLERLRALQASLEATKAAEFPDEKLLRVQQRVDSLRRRVVTINFVLNAVKERSQKLHAAATARHSAALAAASGK